MDNQLYNFMKNIWSYRRGPLDDVHLLPVYLALFNIINIRSIVSKKLFFYGYQNNTSYCKTPHNWCHKLVWRYNRFSFHFVKFFISRSLFSIIIYSKYWWYQVWSNKLLSESSFSHSYKSIEECISCSVKKWLHLFRMNAWKNLRGKLS